MAVVAATPEGFGLASLAEFRATRRVRLLPYGEVRVTYRGPGDDDGMARLVLGLFTDVGDPLLHVESPGGSDGAVAVGSTVPFTQVPPGHHQVMRRSQVGANAWFQSAVRDVVVEPGKVTTVDIEAQGCRVTGRVVAEGGASLEGMRLVAEVTLLQPGTPAAAGHAGPGDVPAPSSRPHCRIRPDGTWVAEDVLPGQYELTVKGLGVEDGAGPGAGWEARKPFSIPGGTAPDAVVDLGSVALQRRTGAGP